MVELISRIPTASDKLDKLANASWLPYSITPYLYLDFHLLCSMTKLKEHSREICYSLMDSRGGVEHIDENEAEGDKKNNPRYYSEYLQAKIFW